MEEKGLNRRQKHLLRYTIVGTDGKPCIALDGSIICSSRSHCSMSPERKPVEIPLKIYHEDELKELEAQGVIFRVRDEDIQEVAQCGNRYLPKEEAMLKDLQSALNKNSEGKTSNIDCPTVSLLDEEEYIKKYNNIQGLRRNPAMVKYNQACDSDSEYDADTEDEDFVNSVNNNEQDLHYPAMLSVSLFEKMIEKLNKLRTEGSELGVEQVQTISPFLSFNKDVLCQVIEYWKNKTSAKGGLAWQPKALPGNTDVPQHYAVFSDAAAPTDKKKLYVSHKRSSAILLRCQELKQKFTEFQLKASIEFKKSTEQRDSLKERLRKLRLFKIAAESDCTEAELSDWLQENFKENCRNEDHSYSKSRGPPAVYRESRELPGTGSAKTSPRVLGLSQRQNSKQDLNSNNDNTPEASSSAVGTSKRDIIGRNGGEVVQRQNLNSDNDADLQKYSKLKSSDLEKSLLKEFNCKPCSVCLTRIDPEIHHTPFSFSLNLDG